MTKKQERDLKWAHFQRIHHLIDDYAFGEFPTPEKAKEKEEKIRQSEKDFLTKQQQDILLFEEEKKKRRDWEENHWVETEGGDGYFN